MRALLSSLEARMDAQHQRLGTKIERLEKRLDAAMARGQAEARLLALTPGKYTGIAGKLVDHLQK